MERTQTQRRQPERGSALLLSLLLTLVGALMMGLAVDGTSLVWAKSHAQTTANLAAEAVGLELERNAGAGEAYLEATARAAAGWNGLAARVRIERTDGGLSVVVDREAEVYFLRMIRPEPVAVRARGLVVRR
jgi:hypothetical protein